ncbi:kallikrein-4-like isoform X2 [Eleginops maclovinus]|uniref:kallikrein-4-like isoform X2 n=1 Tax=Eleginops maclovinus TaxID=56733 RepID=UPI0030804DEC
MAGMMTGLLLLLLAGVTESRVVDLQKRIIGGVECAKTDRLYHVKLVISNGNQEYLCGGTLINKNWILTAGHCVQKGETVTAVLALHPGSNKKAVVFKPDPKRMKDKKGTHDIALLKLPHSVKGFPTATLPECSSRPALGDTVQVAGHAATTDDEGDPPQPGTFQCADTTVVKCDFKNCPSKEQRSYYNPDMVFCYKKDEVDTSPGDSGGGVVFNGMIYGVHIGGGKYACDTPGMALDICQYKKWITDVTESLFGKFFKG